MSGKARLQRQGVIKLAFVGIVCLPLLLGHTVAFLTQVHTYSTTNPPSSLRIGFTRKACLVAASTLTGSRTRPRRRDLKIGKLRPEVPDEAGDDDDSEGGRGKKWVRVYPLGLGLYGGQTAVFLGRRKEVEKENGGRLETLPVPVFTSGDLEMLRAAFREAERRRKMEAEGLQDSQGSKSQFKASSMWTGRHLSTKDNGFFDNAPWEWVERTAREAGESGQSVPTIAATNVKKEAFDAFVFGKNVRADWTSSPYALMLHIITRSLGAAVSELLIDEEDSPRGPGITFGPVLTLQEEVRKKERKGSRGEEMPRMAGLSSTGHRGSL